MMVGLSFVLLMTMLMTENLKGCSRPLGHGQLWFTMVV